MPKKLHWTQKPENKARVRRHLAKANAKKKAKALASSEPDHFQRAGERASAASKPNGNGAFMSVNDAGVITILQPSCDVWPYDNVDTTAVQLGDVIVKVNNRRIE